MPFKGFLESVEPLQITGWAFDPDAPEKPLQVELLRAGDVIGRVLASLYRRDLESADIGQGDHAFVFNCDAPLAPDDLPRITCRIVVPGAAPVPLPQLPAQPGALPAPAEQRRIAFQGICRDETHRPVFILGSARSGTSAVAHGLLTSTRYQGQEEGHFLDVLAPLFVNLRKFYTTKADEISETRNTMVAHIPEDFMMDALSGGAIDAIRQLYPAGYWLDKTPNANMIHLAPRFRAIWPNARFIFMKRRAIENIASRLRKFRYDFAHNCREWADAMNAWLAVRGQLAGVAMELDQYFVAHHPAEAAGQIAELLGLDAREADRLAQALGSGRPQRTSADFATALSLSEMGWSAQNVATFEEICGGLMETFGYDLSRRYYQNYAI